MGGGLLSAAGRHQERCGVNYCSLIGGSVCPPHGGGYTNGGMDQMLHFLNISCISEPCPELPGLLIVIFRTAAKNYPPKRFSHPNPQHPSQSTV